VAAGARVAALAAELDQAAAASKEAQSHIAALQAEQANISEAANSQAAAAESAAAEAMQRAEAAERALASAQEAAGRVADLEAERDSLGRQLQDANSQLDSMQDELTAFEDTDTQREALQARVEALTAHNADLQVALDAARSQPAPPAEGGERDGASREAMELLRQQVAQLQEHAAGLEATVAQLEAELQAARCQGAQEEGAAVVERVADTAALQEQLDEQQREFNDLLACLGQESAKVAALSDILADNGLEEAGEAAVHAIDEEQTFDPNDEGAAAYQEEGAAYGGDDSAAYDAEQGTVAYGLEDAAAYQGEETADNELPYEGEGATYDREGGMAAYLGNNETAYQGEGESAGQSRASSHAAHQDAAYQREEAVSHEAEAEGGGIHPAGIENDGGNGAGHANEGEATSQDAGTLSSLGGDAEALRLESEQPSAAAATAETSAEVVGAEVGRPHPNAECVEGGKWDSPDGAATSPTAPALHHHDQLQKQQEVPIDGTGFWSQQAAEKIEAEQQQQQLQEQEQEEQYAQEQGEQPQTEVQEWGDQVDEWGEQDQQQPDEWAQQGDEWGEQEYEEQPPAESGHPAASAAAGDWGEPGHEAQHMASPTAAAGDWGEQGYEDQQPLDVAAASSQQPLTAEDWSPQQLDYHQQSDAAAAAAAGDGDWGEQAYEQQPSVTTAAKEGDWGEQGGGWGEANTDHWGDTGEADGFNDPSSSTTLTPHHGPQTASATGNGGSAAPAGGFGSWDNSRFDSTGSHAAVDLTGQVAAVKEAPPGATRQQPLPAAPAVQTPGGGQDALFAAFADQGGEEEFLAGGDDESAWERYDF